MGNIHDKRVIIERADGGISILIPVEVKLKNETDAAFFARLTAKAIDTMALQGSPGAVQKAVIDKTELPLASVNDATIIEDYVLDKDTGVVTMSPVPDKIRHARGGWTWDGGKIVVDETAARWSNARAIRDKLLADSDGPMNRENEQGGGNQAAHKAYRQALRDVPDQADVTDINWPVRP